MTVTESMGVGHTPGPLKYDPESGEIYMNDTVCARVAQIDLENCNCREQAHADGYLLAAAPNMFEALKALRDDNRIALGSAHRKRIDAALSASKTGGA